MSSRERITQEDFSPVYMDVRKHGTADSTWPKFVLWALDTPFIYGTMQISATVLQRQLEPYGQWTYNASIKPNDHTVATDVYGTDPYAEIGTISIDEKVSFQDAIDGIYEEIEKLQYLNEDSKQGGYYVR